jgi:hypothetical protein
MSDNKVLPSLDKILKCPICESIAFFIDTTGIAPTLGACMRCGSLEVTKMIKEKVQMQSFLKKYNDSGGLFP